VSYGAPIVHSLLTTDHVVVVLRPLSVFANKNFKTTDTYHQQAVSVPIRRLLDLWNIGRIPGSDHIVRIQAPSPSSHQTSIFLSGHFSIEHCAIPQASSRNLKYQTNYTRSHLFRARVKCLVLSRFAPGSYWTCFGRELALKLPLWTLRRCHISYPLYVVDN
jgi:hypothetical protein